MDRPFISVCLLAHNSASYITTALESVLAQTFQDWELLVSDDASTDETGNLVAAVPRRPSDSLRSPSRESQAGKQLGVCDGEYLGPIITTLHADDAWEPDALQTFADAFREQADLDFVWANWDYYDPGLKIRQRSAPVTITKEMNGNDALSWLLDNNHTLPSATAFTREVTQRAGSPDPRFGMLCDRRYFLQLPMVARRCRAIPKVVMRYRRNEEGVTSLFSRSGRLQEEMILLANDAENLFRQHPHGSELAKRLQVDLGKEPVSARPGCGYGGRSPAGNKMDKKCNEARALGPL